MSAKRGGQLRLKQCPYWNHRKKCVWQRDRKNMSREIRISRSVSTVQATGCITLCDFRDLISYFLIAIPKGLAKAIKRKVLFQLKVQGYSPSRRGSCSDRSMRQPVTSCPQSGSRERWMPLLRLISPFHSVQDPDLWMVPTFRMGLPISVNLMNLRNLS